MDPPMPGRRLPPLLLTLSFSAALAAPARADDLVIVSREHGSWDATLEALRTDLSSQGREIHVGVGVGGVRIPCPRYRLELDEGASSAFLVGGCDRATRETRLILERRAALFETASRPRRLAITAVLTTTEVGGVAQREGMVVAETSPPSPPPRAPVSPPPAPPQPLVPAVAAPPPSPPPAAPSQCRISGGRRCRDRLPMAVMYSVMSSGWAAGTVAIIYYAARDKDNLASYALGGALTGLMAAGEAAAAGLMFWDRFPSGAKKVARPFVTISPAGARLGLGGSF
jgi:hypothetical protein